MRLFDRQLRDWDCYWLRGCALDPIFKADLISEFGERPGSVTKILQILNDCTVAIDADVALAAVNSCRTALRHIPAAIQSAKIVLSAVKSNPMLLAYAAYQSESVALEAVSRSPEALRFVQTRFQTDAVVLAAVQGDPLVLKDAVHQSEAIALEAVKRSPNALKFVQASNQTDAVVFEAIRGDPLSLQYVDAKRQSEAIALEAVMRSPNALKFVQANYQTDAVVLEAIRGDPLSLQYVDAKRQSEAIALEAVRGCWKALQFVDCEFQTDAVVMRAVSADPLALEHARRQPQYAILDAVRANPWVLRYVTHQSEAIALEAISRDASALWHVDPQLRTEGFWLKAIKIAGRSALRYIGADEQTQKLVNAALNVYPAWLKYVKSQFQTERVILYVVRIEPRLLRYAKHQSLAIAQAAVDRDLWSLEWVTPALRKQVLENLIKKRPARRAMLQSMMRLLDDGQRRADKLVLDQAWETLVQLTGLKCDMMPDICIIADPLKAPRKLPDHYFDDDLGIFDILGTYFPDKYNIKIYKGLIDEHAISKGWSSKIIFFIVLIHELAHAITHMGEDKEGNKWDKFSSAPSGVKEMFAQWYTYRCLHFSPFDASYVKIMNAMAKGQSHKYRTYLHFKGMSDVEMNRQLGKARASSIHCPEIICNFCRVAPATTDVERWDTWQNRSWCIPSCAECAPLNQQNWRPESEPDS